MSKLWQSQRIVYINYVRIGFFPFNARRVLSILSNFGTASTSDPGNIDLSNLKIRFRLGLVLVKDMERSSYVSKYTSSIASHGTILEFGSYITILRSRSFAAEGIDQPSLCPRLFVMPVPKSIFYKRIHLI